MTPMTREQLAIFLRERLQLSTIAGSDTFGTILDHDAAWRQQLAEARAAVWEEAAKVCEKLYDASYDREAAFYEAFLDAARACRDAARSPRNWRKAKKEPS